jgi:hypothetical protein
MQLYDGALFYLRLDKYCAENSKVVLFSNKTHISIMY